MTVGEKLEALPAGELKTITREDLPLKTLFSCPICIGTVVVDDIDEWETESGKVTEAGLYLSCSSEPDLEDDDWAGWFRGHFCTPYIDWLPIYEPTLNWLNANFRYG